MSYSTTIHDQAANLYAQAQDGDTESLEEFMRMHEGLVHHIVRQQWRGRLSYEQAIHAGRIGLWHAAALSLHLWVLDDLPIVCYARGLRGFGDQGADRALVRRNGVEQITKLKKLWKSYLWQTACATAAILIVLLVLNLGQAVIISSIGATTFIVFMKPGNPFATPRSVVGGHLVGVLVGSAFALLPHATSWATAVVYALTVGSALLLMAVTNTEHPPAAGTALSVVMAGGTWWVAVVAILTSALLLSLFHRLLRPYLQDL